MLHNFRLAKPYGLANKKLCYIQIYKILEKKTKNVLENADTVRYGLSCWAQHVWNSN